MSVFVSVRFAFLHLTNAIWGWCTLQTEDERLIPQKFLFPADDVNFSGDQLRFSKYKDILFQRRKRHIFKIKVQIYKKEIQNRWNIFIASAD